MNRLRVPTEYQLLSAVRGPEAQPPLPAAARARARTRGWDAADTPEAPRLRMSTVEEGPASWVGPEENPGSLGMTRIQDGVCEDRSDRGVPEQHRVADFENQVPLPSHGRPFGMAGRAPGMCQTECVFSTVISVMNFTHPSVQTGASKSIDLSDCQILTHSALVASCIRPPALLQLLCSGCSL